MGRPDQPSELMRFMDTSRVVVERGDLSDEDWARLGYLLLGSGVTMEGITTPENPLLRANPQDFVAFAVATQRSENSGRRAYSTLVRRYQEMLRGKGGEFFGWLRFRSHPEDAQGPYWRYWEARDLDVTTLYATVAYIDAQLAEAGSPYAQEGLYRRLGSNVGTATLNFWREFAAHRLTEAGALPVPGEGRLQ
jgi:hypothetical protein